MNNEMENKIEEKYWLDRFIERTGHNPSRKKKYEKEWITSKEFRSGRLALRDSVNRGW